MAPRHAWGRAAARVHVEVNPSQEALGALARDLQLAVRPSARFWLRQANHKHTLCHRDAAGVHGCHNGRRPCVYNTLTVRWLTYACPCPDPRNPWRPGPGVWPPIHACTTRGRCPLQLHVCDASVPSLGHESCVCSCAGLKCLLPHSSRTRQEHCRVLVLGVRVAPDV